MSAKRLNLILTEFVENRLDLLAEITGLKPNSVILAALAQYMPDVQPEKPKKSSARKTNSKQKTLGEGNRQKNVAEVVKFFQQKKVTLPIEPKAQLFFDHYESKGWVVGRSPVKNWGSCLTTWLSKNPDWRGYEGTPKNEVDLKDFLEWAKENRTPIYQKYSTARSIEDVDQFYIDEYIDNVS